MYGRGECVKLSLVDSFCHNCPDLEELGSLSLFLQTHADHSLPPYLVGRAKKRSGRTHEEMTENSFPKTDSKMTDWGGQIGHEQLLTRRTFVGEIVS